MAWNHADVKHDGLDDFQQGVDKRAAVHGILRWSTHLYLFGPPYCLLSGIVMVISDDMMRRGLFGIVCDGRDDTTINHHGD